jgi:2-polyprenyl-6-hydroxyphenyl methylase/3-demethylubiquinone-9 3-methyltransferase
MGIGTTIRHRMGRLEIPMADLYRSFFISHAQFTTQLAQHLKPRRILEVGCGDGTLAQRLVAAFPDADYLGIDPAESAGRLYRGPADRAVFRTMTSAELLAENPEPFDLVMTADVLHHIQPDLRREVLRDIDAFTAPDGCYVVKEWAIDRPFFGKLAYWADFYVTGDKNVDFMTNSQLLRVLEETLPDFEIASSSSVRPWKENVLLLLKRP